MEPNKITSSDSGWRLAQPKAYKTASSFWLGKFHWGSRKCGHHNWNTLWNHKEKQRCSGHFEISWFGYFQNEMLLNVAWKRLFSCICVQRWWSYILLCGMEGVKSKTKEGKHLRLKLPHEQSTTKESWELTAFCLFSDKSRKFLQFFPSNFHLSESKLKVVVKQKFPFWCFSIITSHALSAYDLA